MRKEAGSGVVRGRVWCDTRQGLVRYRQGLVMYWPGQAQHWLGLVVLAELRLQVGILAGMC